MYGKMNCKTDRNTLDNSAKRVTMLVVAMLLWLPLAAQSGLYVPSAKPVRDMKKALTNPEVFHLVLDPTDDAAGYAVDDLDLLDSAYGIAFAEDNPMLYTMTIEGYGGDNTHLTRSRVDAVYRYFAMRCHAQFPIRFARNPIRCSCNGDTVEILRYEVPVQTAVYRSSELPEARRLLNKSVDLSGCVLVTFRNNPDECVGSARGCYVPSADSTVYGYYATMTLTKGSVYSVENTKDTCPGGLIINIEDHLNYRDVLDRYHLVPHRRQIIAQAGYIVIRGSWPMVSDSCSEPQKDSIFIRIPVTQEQIDAKLKFFAKVKTSRGMEYKQLPTRKLPGKGVLVLQAPINVTQFDTVYVGKRIQEKEISKYFYEVDSPTEAASFTIDKRFYVASRPGKDGEPQMKKPLKQLFRIVPEQEEDASSTTTEKNRTPKGEEIPE